MNLHNLAAIDMRLDHIHQWSLSFCQPINSANPFLLFFLDFYTSSKYDHLGHNARARMSVESTVEMDFADVWRELRTRHFGCSRLHHFQAHLAINPRVSHFYYCAHNGHHSVHRHRGSSCLDWLWQANLACTSCQPATLTSSTLSSPLFCRLV